MTTTEVWDIVLDILEALPGESLDSAVRRCIREKRAGSWAARRIRRYAQRPGSPAMGRALLYDIARRGKYAGKRDDVL